MPTRRKFLNTTAGAAAALSMSKGAPSLHAQDAGRKIVVGVMGTGGRGTRIATSFEAIENVVVAYVCDVDSKRAEAAAAAVTRVKERAPKVVTDYRRILEDPAVDVVAIATCDHWHAIAGIQACAAGKHVYVEKPCSHNPREGELFIEAARKHDVRVQMGNQRRSHPKIREGIARLKEGVIGRSYYAHCYYNSVRPTIGKGVEGPPPPELDFDLWQGPAPRRPYRDNILHYHWHWFWHWGTGELGNNGVHMLDVARWGLDVDFAARVTSAGGRYQFEDDQETPDTQIGTFEFADRKMITWEGLSCSGHKFGDKDVIVSFIGDNGAMDIIGNGYVLYDAGNKETERVTEPFTDAPHFQNFIDAIRAGSSANLNSGIEEGHRSTLLCHLGNIAWRTRRTLNCDPKNGGQILDDKEAMKLWSRDYEPGWEPVI